MEENNVTEMIADESALIETKKKKKKKTRVIWISAVAVILVAAILGYLFLMPSGTSGPKVFVMSVAEITGNNLLASDNRFAGVVESQETQDIKIEQGREVDEVFVEIGDTVSVGTELFSYKTDEIERKIRQAGIEIEGYRNSINSSYAEIKVLEQEKASAAPENQIDYTLQIQSQLASISQTEYSIKTKQVELEQLKKSLENSVVTAKLQGSVQSINDPDAMDPYSGNALPFMVIMKGGDFLIKGTVSELNVYSLSPGMRVIIRSRINEEQVWSGSITSIDTNQTQDDKNKGGMVYYGGMGGDGGNTATKYSFYVELDSILGLMIGQHVTLEMDLGQGAAKSGIWLSSFYINDLETDPFVWADNGKDKIEKRRLTLGEYDEQMDSYEVVEGLELGDYIAYPDPTISTGQPTTKEFVPPDMNGMEPGVMEPGVMEPGIIEPGNEGVVVGEDVEINGDFPAVDGKVIVGKDGDQG